MTTHRKPGRPHSGNVKLTVHIKPETRAWLGDKPGKRIDEIVKEKQKEETK